MTALVDEEISMKTLDSGEVQGVYFAPKEVKGESPAVLILHGSEGSTQFTSYSAAALARRGYRSLALQYFGGKNQSKNLVRIPLETVQQGFDWLNRQPGVKKGSIAVVGFSRGAEAALCFGEMNSKVRAVVAIAPTSMRFQGFISYTQPCLDAAFTWKSKDLPYAKLHFTPGSTQNLYTEAVVAPENASARIEVEKINGPVMLISGQSDPVWPSSFFGKEIKDRLTQKRFRHELDWRDYPNAGHILLAPSSNSPTKLKPPTQYGGTEEGVGKALTESWPAMIAFLDRTFKK